MTNVSIEEMRREVTLARPGANWPYKVESMPDKQVAAIYYRIVDEKRKKGDQ